MTVTGKVLIIDGDAISYICSKETLEDSLMRVDNILKSMFNYLKCNEYFMFLSFKPYFRNVIDPQYKAHRKPILSLIFLKEIKEYLIFKYNAQYHIPFEADDLVAYTKRLYPHSIVCSTDKDVLSTISGEWFNYKQFKRGYTTDEYALKFKYIQVLMGDVADNIKGVPRIGISKATKIIEPLTLESEMIEACIAQYNNYYKDDIEALKLFHMNLQLVTLLVEDEDYIKYNKVIPDIGEPLIYNTVNTFLGYGR